MLYFFNTELNSMYNKSSLNAWYGSVSTYIRTLFIFLSKCTLCLFFYHGPKEVHLPRIAKYLGDCLPNPISLNLFSIRKYASVYRLVAQAFILDPENKTY